MKFTKITLLIGLLFIFIIGCDEDNEVFYDTEATLIYTGGFNVDGCGFFVEIEGVDYKPENEGIIPPQFKVFEPLSVTVQYIELQYDIEYYCGDTLEAQKTKGIKLISLDLNEDLP